MAAPTASDLAHLMGTEVDADQATAVLTIVTALARSFVRGRGFDDGGEPADDIAAVIKTAAVRLLSDPTQKLTGEVMGPFSATYRSADFGWTTAELAVLHRYRVRAQ